MEFSRAQQDQSEYNSTNSLCNPKSSSSSRTCIATSQSSTPSSLPSVQAAPSHSAGTGYVFHNGFSTISAATFGRPQASADLTLELLNAAIEEHRLSSFDTFDLSIHVFQAAQLAPLRDTMGQFIGHDKYIFAIWGQPDKAMRVRLDIHSGAPLIFLANRWILFSSFLKSLKQESHKDADTSESSKRRAREFLWQHQARWWVANGKSFRVLDLPPEIRNFIYGYAIGDSIEPYLRHNARRLGRSAAAALAQKTNYTLLRISRLVYKEVSDVIFTFTPFYLEHKSIITTLLANAQALARIRQLHLALSHHDFFRLFGGNFTQEGDLKRPSSAAMKLRKMKLTKLRLTIAAPSVYTARERYDGACQKIVVDWILEVAWYVVRGHPVEITGYVKRSQKEAFEAACKVERAAFVLWQKQRLAIGKWEGNLRLYDDWLAWIDEDGYYDDEVEVEVEEGGVRLVGDVDVEATKYVWKAGLVELASEKPECECDVPCTLEAWSAEG